VLGLLCCSDAAAAADSKLHVMFMDVGPEIVTGSTRMKAGTITKMVLNTISTTLMIRAGKIFDNLMIDVKASNNKLMDRAIRIIMAITAMQREDAQALLVESGYNCKIAVIMAEFQCGKEEAEAMNGANKGVIAYF
jgi:N-acetylmuramic acid 6-phosphate etherase